MQHDQDRIRLVSGVLAAALIDEYLHSIFRWRLRKMVDEIEEENLILEASRMFTAPIEKLLLSPFARMIGLFDWKKRGKPVTFAVAQVSATNFEFAPVAGIRKCNEWVAQQTGFGGIEGCNALGRSALQYCKLLKKAQRHRMEGRGEEALLHFVIALDLLLSTGAAGLTSQVASRAAALTHSALGATIQEQEKLVRSLYDSRSKYVHDGTAP